jgi:hypothetical protein
MRIRRAFLSCTVVAALGLFATGTTMAGGHSHGGGSSSNWNMPTSKPSPAPTSCTTGNYTITVTHGPSFVSCASGQCTEIEYTVTGPGTPDEIAVATGLGVQYVHGPNPAWYPPCVGDEDTDIAEGACHEQAAEVHPTSSLPQTFTVGLDGQRSPGPTTIAVKRGSSVGLCRIQGIGLDSVPGQFDSTQTTERLTFEGCAVDFVHDSTGAVLSATLSPESTKPLCSANGNVAPCCSDVITSNIDKLTLTLEGVGELGAGQVGNGTVATGSNSCTTRIIGGRVYTWGSPCP